MTNSTRVAAIVFFVGALVAFGLMVSQRGASDNQGEAYPPVQMTVDPIQPSGKVVETKTSDSADPAAESAPESATKTETVKEAAPESAAPVVPAPAAAPAPRPVVEAAPAQPAPGTPAPAGGVVEKIGIKTTGSEFTVTVECSAPVGEVRAFYLNDRNKYVIDLVGDWQLHKGNVIRVPDGIVKHIVVGEHPGSFIRLVVQLDREPAGPVAPAAVVKNGRELKVSVVLP